MQLVVMRHGQTPANAEERYQGALDIGLSDTGVAQIRTQARVLALTQAPFQQLLSSPLLRARQSAARRRIAGRSHCPGRAGTDRTGAEGPSGAGVTGGARRGGQGDPGADRGGI